MDLGGVVGRFLLQNSPERDRMSAKASETDWDPCPTLDMLPCPFFRTGVQQFI